MGKNVETPPVRTGVFVHSSIYAIGNIATRVGSFLLLPLYTRHMSVADYGALELFYVVSSVVSSFLSVGLAHATLRFYFEFDDIKDRNKVVTSCLISTLLYATPLLTLLAMWNQPLAHLTFGEEKLANGFYWVFAILILELMRQIGLAYFRAREYSTMYVGVCLLQLVVQVICNVYTVGFQKSGVIGILQGNFVSVLTGWAFIMFVVFRECGFGYDFSKMKAIFKYSYPFLLTSLTAVILSNLDRIILRATFSLAEVGLYALAFKFGSLVQELVIEPFTRSFGAYRFKIMNDSDSQEELARVFSRFMIIIVVAGLGIGLFARDVIRIMSTPEYWDAYKVIPLVVLSFLSMGASYQFQTGLLFKKQTHHLVTINFTASAINVLFYVILIPWLGMYGAAISVVLKNTIEALFTYRVSQRYYPIPFDFTHPLKTLAVATLAVLVARALSSFSVWVTIPFDAALFTAFVVFLYVTGEIQKGEITQCVGIVRSGVDRIFSRFRQA